MSRPAIHIQGRAIGRDHEPYVIAEVSANHNGDVDQAMLLMTEAASCGADAVKIQTYTPDTMTIDSDGSDFRIEEGTWAGETLYDLYSRAQTPFEWHQRLFAHARDLGITLFSTPFDDTAVDLLESLDTPAYKIASFEAIDLPLIRTVAQTGKPVIISTGMADLEEIGEAVQCVRDNGNPPLALLHCVSAYPAPIEQTNLRTIPDLESRFETVVGLSDHTLGTTAAVASIPLGASIVEKHFIMKRTEGGPDASFSIEPDELRQLKADSTSAWQALGEAGYDRKDAEEENLVFRRSIYCVRDIRAGEAITSDHVRIIRPGYGLAPRHLDNVLGRAARTDISRGTALSWELVE
jgi:N-acetylneuraminate synthase